MIRLVLLVGTADEYSSPPSFKEGTGVVSLYN
jgi:hypothetical protein